jgi:hypothetical protein
MGIWISNFNTTAAFEDAESSLATPHVSLTKDNMQVHFKPYVEPQINNTIIYKASAKLTETTSDKNAGLHTNAFSGTSSQLTMTSHAFENGVGTIIFSSDITSIGKNAFYGCGGITEITVPNSITSICIDGAGNTSGSFEGCSGLTSINIPSGVTSIGIRAFYYCSGLTSIDIPSGVTNIGQGAFSYCTSLTSIDIPSGVTNIGQGAFYYCSGLTSITCYATTAPTIQSHTFGGVKARGTLTVPSGSSGYDVWMGTSQYYLGYYNWTKVEQ